MISLINGKEKNKNNILLFFLWQNPKLTITYYRGESMNPKNTIEVIVDAGHGGMDSGAIGNNLQEKDLTLQAAKYMYKRLQELGIPSILTREEDEYLPKEERIKRIKDLTSNNPNTILISNHINAGGGEGAEVVYSLKNNPTLANLILDNIGEAGQIKRKIYQRRLPENPNLDYYYILRESGSREPVLVEYGFIDNKKDSIKLKNNIEDYVEGVVKAIAEYLGYPYQEPGTVPTKDTYIVQKGDTLYSISKKTSIPIEEIKRINNLTSNTLSIGQVLLLKEKNNISTSTYTVKKGDSLWKIAKEYKITVPELIEMNQLKDLTLQIGQVLIVPQNEDTTYTVQKGDTLWSIAKKFNLGVEELKEINQLASNLLSIGQILKIQ